MIRAFFPITLLLAVFLNTASGYPDTVMINPGDDIQSIINRAKPEDEITFQEGQYVIHRGIVIKNKINVRIKSNGAVRIVSTDVNNPIVSILNCSQVIFQEMELKYQTTSAMKKVNTIDIKNGLRVGIISCDISTGLNGISAVNSRLIALIQNNIHHNNKAGITLLNIRGALLQNNTVSENRIGLVKTNVTELEMKNNDIRDNRVR